MMKICDALAMIGNNACHEHIGQKKFFEGLFQIRCAMYEEMVNAISNCFVFAGVGGEEVKEFSRAQFKELFHDDPNKLRNSVMHLLDFYGQTPHAWKDADDKQLRKEAKDAIAAFTKKKAKKK